MTGEPAHRRARRGLARTFQIARVFGSLTAIENLLVAVPRQRGESVQGIIGGRRAWVRQERELVERARDLLQEFGMAAGKTSTRGTERPQFPPPRRVRVRVGGTA